MNVSKEDAIACCEKLEDFFTQFETGRFDHGLHVVHNDEIQGTKEHIKVIKDRVRKQLKFGEL